MGKFVEKLSCLSCGVCIIIAGYLLAGSINNFVESKRIVMVKGLSEKTVKADTAIWPISFKETGDKLAVLEDRLLSNRKKVRSFLERQGFSKEEMTDTPMAVVDYFSQIYDRPVYRYMLHTTVLLRTDKVDLVKKAMGSTGDLIGQSIVIDMPPYGPSAEFLYTKLNVIKPDMLGEATQNAKEAAIQFAADSQSRIGAIKSAQQGLFTITDRDSSSPDWKNIRVVSTVEFFLVD